MQLFQFQGRPALAIGAFLLLALTAPAQAQYAWIDAGGARVFSDRPPPPGTPAERILKAPRVASVAPYGALPAPAATPAPTAPARPAAPTVAEREADYRKRSAKAQEAERASAKQASQQASKDAYCKQLKRDEMALGTQGRLSEVDEKGERRYLGDEERAGRLAALQRRQAEECR